tara:strand:- start:1326 stop:1988 length:663 start_codon:yes stop_codon:yes gene_type:complete
LNGHFQEFEDQYLITMYDFFESNPGQRVRTGDLASSLDVSPASATEMVQRLAAKGFIDYEPYKGALFTESGLIRGKKMKRRHRLAEVLLETLSFQGDIHETACRLEHAINDDLEVTLSLLLGHPVHGPVTFGTEMPDPSPEILDKIQSSESKIQLLNQLNVGETGVLDGMLMNDSDKATMNEIGLELGAVIQRTESGYMFGDGENLVCSPQLSSKLLIRV